MHQKENAKTERRQRILKAAIALTADAGLNGFSMRDLAKHAGVSHATPFNLFGSKGQIISEILELDLKEFENALFATDAPDALARLFDLARLATPYYIQKESLYRGLFTSFHDNRNEAVRQRFARPRHKLFSRLVRQAQGERLIRRELSSDLVARTINQHFAAVLMQWIWGEFSLERMERELCFGLAALLAGFATPAARKRLTDQMLVHQAEVLDYLRSDAAARPDRFVV